MTEKWTPGPWKRADRNAHHIHTTVTRNDQMDVICTVQTRTPEHDANARLIAASPDMYKRLKETTDLLGRLLDEEAVPESDRPELAVQITYNEDALAKARGET